MTAYNLMNSAKIKEEMRTCNARSKSWNQFSKSTGPHSSTKLTSTAETTHHGSNYYN